MDRSKDRLEQSLCKNSNGPPDFIGVHHQSEEQCTAPTEQMRNLGLNSQTMTAAPFGGSGNKGREGSVENGQMTLHGLAH